jgi:hypothetical protein
MIKEKNLRKTPDGKFKVGDDIYLHTSLYLSHGEDDFDGGLCEIIRIEETSYGTFLYVKEDSHAGHNYKFLLEEQEELKKIHGKRRGRKNPDYSFESNCWACPGDIVDGKKIDYYIP